MRKLPILDGEDNMFAWPGCRLPLFARDPAEYLFRYSTGSVEPINLGLGDIGTHPGTTRVRIQIYAGMFRVIAGILIRAAGFFFGWGEVF
jgi:hypothetical protein